MGRTDDVINVAGHRLSTGRMEEVLAAHPDIAECAVVGVADELKGEVPLGLVVLKAGADRRPDGAGRGAGGAGAPADRAGSVLQDRDRGEAAAQDAVGKDRPGDGEEDRGRRAVDGAGDHR